jgi:inorganic pyrophosphatase
MDDARWHLWEQLILIHDLVIDRPKGTAHPRYPDMIYPVDYGYLPGTAGGDGAGIDIFAGEANTGLVGVVQTHDALKGDREIKLLWNVTPDEIDAIVRLLNTGSMTATVILRSHADLPPTGRTLEEFLDRVGWLDEPLDDFMDIMRDRYLNEIPQERILFEEDDLDNG